VACWKAGQSIVLLLPVVKSEAIKASWRWPMTMTTTTRDVHGVTIVDIKGRIVLGEESAALRELVADLVGKGQRKILLNFVDVNYIDSSGLGNLVSSLVRVRMYDGELKLLNLTKRVHDVMQVTKLNAVFDIMNDETVAVKSFRQSAGATGRLAP
jgi:anti-sigma B factor antagonist